MFSHTQIIDDYIRNLDNASDNQMQSLHRTADQLADSPIVMAHCAELLAEGCEDLHKLVWLMATAIEASRGTPAKLIVFPGGKRVGAA